MKLFAIYIGGRLPGANIELHDMRFVVAASIRDTHDALRQQWWGLPASLHIDCWAELDHADGYDVTLSPEPFTGNQKLYYVNLGGYDRAEFTEQHKNVFVVAESINQAKARALATVRDWSQPHRDDLYEAEQAFALNEVVGEERLHLHLSAASGPRTMSFSCRYTPIGRQASSTSSGSTSSLPAGVIRPTGRRARARSSS